MPTFTVNGVEFDTAAAPSGISHGYTKAQRDALADETLIKVRNQVIKTNLSAKLTKGLQVTTYNPADMKDSNNFFNFVSQWETVILAIETHLKTYYMESPFTLYVRHETRPDIDAVRAYEFALGEFLRESAANGGDGASYVDSTTATAVNRPTAPAGTVTISDGGDIIRNWHTMTLQQVCDSVKLQLEFVADDVHRQNLVWTFSYIMDGLDADLKAFVLSKISKLTPDIGRTGPVAFMIVAQRILQTTENLAQKVINGFIALRLTHFEGDNVIECIFTLRNVLKFLRFGEAETFAPRTTIVILYDVFRGTTVSAFRNFVQQAQDIILKDISDPEIIFDHLQSKYEELLLADRWVPTKKRQSAFHVGETQTYVDADKKDKDKKPAQGQAQGGSPPKDKKERPTHDKSGRKIDYTPPKNGEPHERERDGRKEFWCGRCGRWGSHKTDGHDEWRKNFKGKGRKGNGGNASANVASSGSSTAPTTRGSVTFLSALTGNSCVTINPELADGIDL